MATSTRASLKHAPPARSEIVAGARPLAVMPPGRLRSHRPFGHGAHPRPQRGVEPARAARARPGRSRPGSLHRQRCRARAASSGMHGQHSRGRIELAEHAVDRLGRRRADERQRVAAVERPVPRAAAARRSVDAQAGPPVGEGREGVDELHRARRAPGAPARGADRPVGRHPVEQTGADRGRTRLGSSPSRAARPAATSSLVRLSPTRSMTAGTRWRTNAAVRGGHVVGLEVGRGGEHDVGVAGRVGEHLVVHDGEEVLAGTGPAAS